MHMPTAETIIDVDAELTATAGMTPVQAGAALAPAGAAFEAQKRRSRRGADARRLR
jgi:hypothetical protein